MSGCLVKAEDLREDVVERVIGEHRHRPNATTSTRVVRVHEAVGKREVLAEGAADLDSVVGREPTTAAVLRETHRRLNACIV